MPNKKVISGDNACTSLDEGSLYHTLALMGVASDGYLDPGDSRIVLFKTPFTGDNLLRFNFSYYGTANDHPVIDIVDLSRVRLKTLYNPGNLDHSGVSTIAVYSNGNFFAITLNKNDSQTPWGFLYVGTATSTNIAFFVNATNGVMFLDDLNAAPGNVLLEQREIRLNGRIAKTAIIVTDGDNTFVGNPEGLINICSSTSVSQTTLQDVDVIRFLNIDRSSSDEHLKNTAIGIEVS